MELEIRMLDGKSTTLEVNPQDTIAYLKKKLLRASNPFTPSPHFHLFLRGSKLSLEVSIESLGLRDAEFMVLIPYSKRKQAVSLSCQDTATCAIDYRTLEPENSNSAETSVFVHPSVHLSDVGSRNSHAVHAEAVNDSSTSSEKEGSKSLSNISAAIWNELAADLSSWKMSIDALDDVSVRPLLDEHRQESMHTPSCLFPTRQTSEAVSTLKCGNTKNDKRTLTKATCLKKPVHDGLEDECINKEKSKKASREATFSKDQRPRDDLSEYASNYRKRARVSWSCPVVLTRQYHIFRALNLVYGFLQKQHMQGTWCNMKVALQQLCGFLDEEIQVNEIEDLAYLFPQLVQVSSRTGEGPNLSFKIDLLDPSKLSDKDSARSLHEVMPFELQKGIGPSDHLPNPGTKQISDNLIKRSIRNRQVAFERAVDNLIKHCEESQTDGSGNITKVTLDDLRNCTKKLRYSTANENKYHGFNGALPRPPKQHRKLKRCLDTTDYCAEEMVEHLKQCLGALGQIMHCEIIEPREAQYGELAVRLSDITAAALKRLHISELYVHQAEAINAAVRKESVIIATSTASGKSLCYNIPVLDRLFCDPDACSLYLFPTKALAQDQFRALMEMTSGLEPEIRTGVYDGDTPQRERLFLRDHSRLLITNPDMLHVSILPSHKQFERLLSNLRYVVVDEAHAYRGAFGCHTAVILRRLRRLCHHLYGAEPTFIVSSATVANPREHAMELLGLRNIRVVQEDGSPQGKKYFLLWDPPMYFSTKPPSRNSTKGDASKQHSRGNEAPRELQFKRFSPIVEVSSLLSEMVQHNLRCISFCKTRKLSELVLSYCREILKETAPTLVDTIRAYRAGYTAQDRRDIESDLFGGRLRAVAATNALELGVDVGSLDATLHLGFPGTMASLWQQAGRAGRREKPSMSIYVAFGSPLDQYFMKHPSKLFSRAIEHAQIDASNPQVLDQHIACAALEHPVNVEYDDMIFGSGLQTSISRLIQKGKIGQDPLSTSQDNTWHYIGQEKSPAQSVSIRAVDPEKYTIINQQTNGVIEEVEESKAFFEVYEGAVYIHQGRTYLVKTLDLGAKVAICQEADVKYYTKTRDFTDVHVVGGELAYPRKAIDVQCPTTTAQASFCKVTTRWIGFRRIWQGTNQTFDSVDLFLPDYSYESQAAWIRVPHAIRSKLDNAGLPFRAGLHAASHALLNIMPLYILCNSSDLGTECANPHDTRYFPERLLVFDRHPGGIGIAAQAQPLFAELLQAALELLTSCECSLEAGCPNCVQYLACSEYNEVLNKPAAVIILQGVIDAEESYRHSTPEIVKEAS